MRELEQTYQTALQNKHNKAAIVREVTIPDEHEELLFRTANAANRPAMRRWYDKKGFSYDGTLPEGYDRTKAKLTRRIDFLIFESTMVTAVEMKISRADFRRDTEEKRRAWKAVTNRFVYLTPAGLLKPEEIPEGCGLWEYDNGTITVVKKAVVNKTPALFPASMIKYFAWRVFLSETPRTGRGRRRR